MEKIRRESWFGDIDFQAKRNHFLGFGSLILNGKDQPVDVLRYITLVTTAPVYLTAFSLIDQAIFLFKDVFSCSGNYRFTQLDLSANELSRFEEAAFKTILQDMPSTRLGSLNVYPSRNTGPYLSVSKNYSNNFIMLQFIFDNFIVIQKSY